MIQITTIETPVGYTRQDEVIALRGYLDNNPEYRRGPVVVMTEAGNIRYGRWDSNPRARIGIAAKELQWGSSPTISVLWSNGTKNTYHEGTICQVAPDLKSLVGISGLADDGNGGAL